MGPGLGGDTTSRPEISPEPSVGEWQSRLGAGELSARELAEHYLKRIDSVNARLNAVVALEPELTLSDAEVADRRRRAGEQGALLGIPITVKDALDVAGFVSTGGSYARAGFRPERDATAVARLRGAGAVVLGKTNLPEFSSSYETNNALHGRTNNPIDADRTPGGSSGGEAAIIGADASPAGIGTDGGGSIRAPSHYCGIVGLRPTVGRVPETGNWPPTRASGMMDLFCVGPLARFVADLETLLGVIAGPDGLDPYAVDVPLRHSAAVPAELRVGWYPEDGVARLTDGTRAAVERAAAALADVDCAVERTEPGDLTEATELFFAAAAADGGEAFRELAAAAGGRHHHQFKAFLDQSQDRRPTAAEFFALQGRIFDFRARVRAFVSGFDVVLCPAVAGPAPLHDKPPGHHPEEEYLSYEGFNHLHAHAVAGLPAAVVPVAEEDGLPIGVQVVSAPWREDLVLAAAARLEQAVGGFTPTERRGARR